MYKYNAPTSPWLFPEATPLSSGANATAVTVLLPWPLNDRSFCFRFRSHSVGRRLPPPLVHRYRLRPPHASATTGVGAWPAAASPSKSTSSTFPDSCSNATAPRSPPQASTWLLWFHLTQCQGPCPAARPIACACTSSRGRRAVGSPRSNIQLHVRTTSEAVASRREGDEAEADAMLCG